MVERANSKQQHLIDQLRDMFKTAQKSSSTACAQPTGFSTQRKSTDAATLRSKKLSIVKNSLPAAPSSLAKGPVNKIPSTIKMVKKNISRTGIAQLNNSSIVNKTESIQQLNKSSTNKIYQTDVKKEQQAGSENKTKAVAQLNASQIRIQSRLVDNLNLSALEAPDAVGF